MARAVADKPVSYRKSSDRLLYLAAYPAAMDFSFETLTVLSFLIPGFISVFMFRHLVYREKTEIAYFLVEALIYSFLIYAIVGAIFHSAPVLLEETTNGDQKTYSVHFVSPALGALLLTSVGIPIGLALVLNGDYVTRIFRWLRVTTVSSRANTWLDAFGSEKRYIIINTTDGKRIFGWPMWYSNSPEDGYIYLYNPSWIDSEQKFVPTGLHGLFLVKKASIDYIEFTNITDQTAKEKDDAKKDSTS